MRGLIPSRWLVAVLAAPAGFALLAWLEPSLTPLLWALDAIVLLLAVLDAQSVRTPLVSAEREAPEVLSIGQANPIRFVLRSRAKRTLSVWLDDALFAHARAEGLPARLSLEARASGSLEYRLFPERRGAYELGPCRLRYASWLGLWIRQIEAPTRQAVRVYPDLLQLRRFEMLARENRAADLARATRRKGGETEFARLRDYATDDEYRSIDWKATARKHKLIAREYQLESNQELVFVLDCGRMMSAEVQGLTQFDHALNAALMLGHVAARTGDRVGLLAFGKSLEAYVPPAGGRAAAGRLIRATYDLHPELEESDYESAFRALSLRQPKRALIVILTQVVDDAVARSLLLGCKALSRRHLPLVVSFRDPEVDALLRPTSDSRADLYVRAAAAELSRWRASFLRDLRHGGAQVLDVGPKELSLQLIERYFEIKARHWL
ncbi:MAG TPA: DUF58 domain-containing protein [Polyangiaceae bacterium]|nr:DUF58 domain-containing protein [Polyangiaceae bacterium]